MKIGIIQSNATIGAFEKNATKLLVEYTKLVEQGAELIITPELSVVGYPPQDLLYQAGFLRGNDLALAGLAKKIGEIPILVGCLREEDTEKGKLYFNSAVWLERGEIVRFFDKKCLPDYDVFGESRYFERANSYHAYEWKGHKLGITICEDIWPQKEGCLVEFCHKEGVELVLNLSASPYEVGKFKRRENLLQQLAFDSEATIVYVNAIGGQDELIFDGHSMVVGACGKRGKRLLGFKESSEVICLESLPALVEGSKQDPNEELYRALVLGLSDYVEKCGFKSVCLGLSGGIDSALTAVIATEALGAEKVYAYALPSKYSSKTSFNDAQALARELGIHFDAIGIQDSVEELRNGVLGVIKGKPKDIVEQNLQARARGVTLMALANQFNHLLLSTGNKSELAVGYCTIYGDMCGGVNVLADLYKTQVYELAEWINRDDGVIPTNVLTKLPTAELKPNQKDQDTLPDYELLDGILKFLIEKPASFEVIARELECELSLVEWVYHRMNANEWKRKQGALGLKVSAKTFGGGRQMPIVHRYQGG